MNSATDLRRDVERLQALPSHTRRLMRILAQPGHSTDSLLEEIRSQPRLGKRMLELSNSAVWDIPRAITDLSETVAYLGVSNLVRMVVCDSLLPFFTRRGSGHQAAFADAYRHSLACGIATQELALATNSADSRTAFATGALHNIGRLVLIPKVATRRDDLRIAAADGKSIVEIERAALGIDHAAAGALIADRWELPDNLRRTIRMHHQPELIADDDELTPMVYIADILLAQMGISAGVRGMLGAIHPAITERLHLRAEDYDRIRAAVHRDLPNLLALIGLAELPDPRPRYAYP